MSRVARAMAREHPDEVVLETAGGRMTHRQLDERADRLAHRILGQVSGTGQRIGMQLTGTESVLVSSLAIVRTGMVIVGIDPTAPPEWRDEILRDCGAALLLAEAGDGSSACPRIDPSADEPGRGDPVDLPVGPVAAIVYTSGSTGVPKGVVWSGSWVDGSVESRFREPTRSRLGLIGQGSVGLACRLLLWAVQHRSPIVAYEMRGRGQEIEQSLGDWLARTRVESLMTVPTVLRHLLKTMPPSTMLPDLRVLMLTGETATSDDLARVFDLLSPNAVVAVRFGTTETGAFAASSFTANSPPPPGPIAIVPSTTDGFRVDVEDDLGQRLPHGEVGQLVVATPSSALGYWRRPDLEDAVFQRRADGKVHIRTGDAARRRSDGSIELLGRLDHVVKVAGNRVALTGVEEALLHLGGVADAVVAPYLDEAGSTRLTAAVVASTGYRLSPRVLRAETAARLPSFMVPDEVAVLAELPRLGNGKVDRGAVAMIRDRLPVEPGPVGGGASDPTAMLADSLRAIFCEVLGRSDVGMHDDFFEHGGDSLRAVELFFVIEQQLGLRCGPALLLLAPTPSDLAHALSMRSVPESAVVPIQLGDVRRAPLFVVNAATYGISVGRLAQLLGADQPVYEVWASAAEATFEDVAARCVAAVSAVAPTGRLVLYGFSLSGVLAFEMALQLQAVGRPPALVVLGDPDPPDLSGPMATARRWADTVAGMWRRTVADPRPSVTIRRATGRGRRALAARWHPHDQAGARPPNEAEWYRHCLLKASYQPAAQLACPVVFHRSEYRPFSWRGWTREIVGKLQVRTIPGQHRDQSRGSLPDVARSLILDLPGAALSRERGAEPFVDSGRHAAH